jgi:hypothetical protein
LSVCGAAHRAAERSFTVKTLQPNDGHKPLSALVWSAACRRLSPSSLYLYLQIGGTLYWLDARPKKFFGQRNYLLRIVFLLLPVGEAYRLCQA